MLSYRDQEGRTKSLIRFLALWINTSSNNILVSFKVTLVPGIFVKMPNLCAFFPSFTWLDVTLASSFVMMSTDISRLGHGPFSLLLLFLPLPPPAPNHLLPWKKIPYCVGTIGSPPSSSLTMAVLTELAIKDSHLLCPFYIIQQYI